MIRAFALAVALAVAPVAASAHGLVVFASVDCTDLIVEAKFANGKVAQKGEVRVLDGENNLMETLELTADGTARVALDSIDHSGGVVVQVDTGGHDDYWILTPEDISSKCGS